MGRWGISLFISRSGKIGQSSWLGCSLFARSARTGAAYMSSGQVENGIRTLGRDARSLDAGRFRTPVAQHRRRAFACALLVDQILQRDGVEILDHLLVERRPEL